MATGWSCFGSRHRLEIEMRSKNTDYIHITSTIAEFQKQNYSKLKSTCLEEKRLFVDDLFPPNDTSIYKNRKIPGLEWKRPKVC